MPALTKSCLVTTMLVLQMNYCDSRMSNDKLNDIIINNDGTSAGNTKTISCKSGQRIYLTSYKYQFFDGTSIKEEKDFSDTEELELHQMCSMKETCTDLRFSPNTDRFKNTTYKVAVEYSCIEPKTTYVIDMCANITRSIRGTVHLQSSEPAILSNGRCDCHIQGKCSVTLNDLRLYVKRQNTCSSASLKINIQKFKCSENQTNFGSIFKRKTLDGFELVYVLLDLNSKSIPAMVWLIIEPAGISNITCSSNMIHAATQGTTTTSPYLPSNLTNSTLAYNNLTDPHVDEESLPPTNIITLVIIVAVVCVMCLLTVIVFVSFGWYLYTRRKKKEKREDPPREVQENWNPANSANEPPVQPNMRMPEYLPADNRLCESMYDKLQTNSCYYSEAKASASNFQNPTFEDEYDNTQLRNVGTTRDSNYDHVPFVNAKL